MRRFLSGTISVRLFFLLLLVVALGLSLYFEIWEKPHRIESAGPSKNFASLSGRSPASIENSQTTKSDLLEPNRIAEVEFECEQESPIRKLKNITQVRLKGHCGKTVAGITNKNNGYTANIFQASGEFTTDYLSLDSGANSLEVKLADGADGNIVTKIQIVVEKQ